MRRISCVPVHVEFRHDPQGLIRGQAPRRHAEEQKRQFCGLVWFFQRVASGLDVLSSLDRTEIGEHGRRTPASQPSDRFPNCRITWHKKGESYT